MRVFGLGILLAAPLACTGETSATTRPVDHGGPDEPDADPPLSPGTSAPTTTTDSTTEPAVTTSTTTTGDPGSTTWAETSAPPPPGTCGDGEQDPGEQCDDGYQHNSDTAACTSTCKLAGCGDGLVWSGHEQCDRGPNNNDIAYGGCTESCTLGPRCADGLLQPEEECDPTAPPIEGTVACDPGTCRHLARLAFVTTATYTGDLGGLALADARCAEVAASQGLDRAGSFTAWLSDGVATPASRLENAAADPGTPYASRDGKLLADDLADLVTHGPKLPLDVTETGATLPTNQFAWTNLGADGKPVSAVNHCKEWTSTSLLDTAAVGKISPASDADLPTWKTQRRWTNDITRSCKQPAHLYCFED